MRALLLAFGLLAAPAVAADQFDLVCRGKQRVGIGNEMKPIEHRYRADLAAKKWCMDGCTRIDDIAAFNDNEIAFINVDRKIGSRFWESDKVYRTTGFWLHVRSGAYDGIDIEGRCEPAAFSGFPEIQRKF